MPDIDNHLDQLLRLRRVIGVRNPRPMYLQMLDEGDNDRMERAVEWHRYVRQKYSEEIAKLRRVIEHRRREHM